ncbi:MULTISPECIES: GNAT family N-acetyltransferase [Bacillus cereus group]|uniref:GNAT family N-acetyltransferase n=1 Tax=Bacillus cereus group TaxID=86661 RepID=UPI000279D261|nr:GNAT family N-acetyltransferase [Bacillus cereus]EJR92246.1 hypothetical protein IKA_00819 [Bacillus cereus VD169]MDA2488272.1 GNAT family N-acetyltransferase [Bacillus cereus]MEB8703443.1 GNAT family N-acetyltransferase [Bacillus cereus]
MTHPDYRHQGLATKLMNHIIKKYEKDYDFIYLFANDTMLEFYPKFGFEKVQESSFSLKVSNMICQIDKKYDLRKLDVNNQADFELMKEYEAERIPVSSRLGLKNSNIIHFNMLIIFVVLLVKGVLSTKNNRR